MDLCIETVEFGRRSLTGVEPVQAEAKRTLGRGLRRANGAPSVGVAGENGGKRQRLSHSHTRWKLQIA